MVKNSAKIQSFLTIELSNQMRLVASDNICWCQIKIFHIVLIALEIG